MTREKLNSYLGISKYRILNQLERKSMKVNVYDIKRAIKKGDLEVLIQDNKIYLNDPQSGDCVKIMQFEHENGIKWIEVDK